MKCPACNDSMIVVEHEKIELDYCANCSGVWFDTGELELLMEKMSLDRANLSMGGILALPDVKSAEKRRRCPICHRKMKKAVIGREPEVLADACPLGHGLWFDSGEVGQLLTQLPQRAGGGLDPQGSVITFLGEVFKARDQ